MQKAFKVTLIPNHNQQVLINKTIGCARFVYNRFLALRKELYNTEEKTLNYHACSQQLTLLKKEIVWLKEVDKFALQNSLKNLETAYKNLFTDLKKAKNKQGVGFPKFKKKYGCKQSYKTNLTNGNIQIKENRLKLPKLGWVKFHKSQDITGKLVNVTITFTHSGKYIASILCETEIEKYPQVTQNIGLDLGIKSYLVTSQGEVVDNPKYYRTQKRKLRKAHKKLSRTVKGSNNRVKAKIKLARTYQSITNSRKALWHDRVVQKVGTFYPSSQTCNHCGFINPLVKDLKLREWSCLSCNSYNLRDKNGALNILSEGLRLLTAVGTPEVIKNACGELVSPELFQAQIVEAGIA
jgi:putative transposase